MKKIIIQINSFVCFLPSFCQQVTPKQDWKDTDYYKKSTKQKTAAWILTGAGTMGLMATLAVDATQEVGGAFVTLLSLGTVEPEKKSYTVPYLLSTAVIVSGIYFFIASSENKKKARAASVFIDTENMHLLRGTVFVRQSFPAVGVKIHL